MVKSDVQMRVGSSWNIEAHRLKNRLRQQRYRARKREEKARRDAEIPVLAEMSISSLPSVSNSNPMQWHDISPLSVDNPEPKNGTSSGGSGCRELDNSPHDVYAPAETGSFQVRCVVRQEDRQSYAELSPSQADSLTPLGEHHISDLSKIQNPLFQVEHSGHVNNQNMQYIYTMASPESENTGSSSNIMARRLKNRERQRRYRARKRLEADMKRAHLLNQPELVTLETQQSRDTCNARVHCKRNWKEDARRAIAPEPGDTKSSAVQSSEEGESKSFEIQSPTQNVNGEYQPQASPLQVRDTEAPYEDGVRSECAISNATQSGRRDWKMDARNSKVA